MKKFVVPLTLALTLVGLVTYKALADADATVTAFRVITRVDDTTLSRLIVTSYTGQAVQYQKIDTSVTLSVADSVLLSVTISGEAIFRGPGRLFLGPSKLASETLSVKDTFSVKPSEAMRGTQIVPFTFTYNENYASDSDTTMPFVWRGWTDSRNRSVQLQNVVVTYTAVNW